MAPRKPRGGAPAKGEWVASTCQGCNPVVRDPDLVQDGRAVRVPANPLSKEQPWVRLPAWHLIPAQVYDPDRIKVP